MVSVAVQQIKPDQMAQLVDSTGMGQQVAKAIQVAANKTGVDFAYLLNKAQQESGGDPNAKASGSSASGLFQFTGQTWLKMVKAYGTKYGMGDYADQIKVDKTGTAHVSDPVWRKAILGLRQDPQISAEMAGELDKENAASLKSSVAGKIGSTELYLAHFLGASGASEFLNTLHDDPSAKAAEILPAAAGSNPSVFYDANGTPRSVAQIYQHFARKFDKLPSSQPAPTTDTAMVADATPSIPVNQRVSLSSASSYIVADAKAARSAYSASIANSANTNSSSLFSTMVLAQMKMDDITSTATSASNAYTKKNAISVLGAVA